MNIQLQKTLSLLQWSWRKHTAKPINSLKTATSQNKWISYIAVFFTGIHLLKKKKRKGHGNLENMSESQLTTKMMSVLIWKAESKCPMIHPMMFFTYLILKRTKKDCIQRRQYIYVQFDIVWTGCVCAWLDSMIKLGRSWNWSSDVLPE